MRSRFARLQRVNSTDPVTGGSEKWLSDHLKACHANHEVADIWQNCCQGELHEAEVTLLAYYMAAVRAREREHMPLIGHSVGRRTLAMVHKLSCDATVQGMVCCVCASVHTHVETSSVCGHA